MKLSWAVILAGALCSAPSTAATVLLMGDSIGAGYGLAAGQGWADVLQSKLATAGDYTLRNASLSGETSGGGLARLDGELAQHHPRVVVLELGANDGLRGLPIARMEANLQQMIEHSRAAGAEVILLGMRMPPNYGARYSDAFGAAYRHLAERLNVAFVPFLLDGFAQDLSAFQPDGIHPAASVQTQMAERVWAVLAGVLKR